MPLSGSSGVAWNLRSRYQNSLSMWQLTKNWATQKRCLPCLPPAAHDFPGSGNSELPNSTRLVMAILGTSQGVFSNLPCDHQSVIVQFRCCSGGLRPPNFISQKFLALIKRRYSELVKLIFRLLVR